jgi:hypothetical protein
VVIDIYCCLSLVFRTFAPCHLPSCSGINSLQLFIPTFDAHRGLSSKTTLTMSLRRLSQRLYPGDGPPQESTDNPPLHQTSTQILPTTAEEPEHPTFENTPEVHLHQPSHASTPAAGPSQNSGTASSSQVSEGALRQSPPRAPLPIHMFPGDVELD